MRYRSNDIRKELEICFLNYPTSNIRLPPPPINDTRALPFAWPQWQFVGRVAIIGNHMLGGTTIKHNSAVANSGRVPSHTNIGPVAMKWFEMKVPNHARNADTIVNPWCNFVFNPLFQCFPQADSGAVAVICASPKGLERFCDLAW